MSESTKLQAWSIDEMGKRFVDAWHELENREKNSMNAGAESERLARVCAMARQVWNSEDDAQAFLNAPHPMLQGRTPLEFSLTEEGARRVEKILQKLFFGISS